MPKAKQPKAGLTDTWGRKNRILEDRECAECKKIFRPVKKYSKYCSRPCMWKNNGKNQERKPVSWWKNQRGYIEGRMWLDDGTKINVKQHRWIMMGIIGRALEVWEDVHHINGIKDDNRPENLEIISHSEHTKEHSLGREHKKGYKLNLSQEERNSRSLRAIARLLSKMGRDAIKNKAEGK